MASKKTFINPLTRSSEEDLHIPAPPPPPSTDTSTEPPEGSPLPTQFQSVRKRGDRAFEKVNKRFTGWMERSLEKGLDDLAKIEGVSKTSLLNEAVADLLRKRMRK